MSSCAGSRFLPVSLVIILYLSINIIQSIYIILIILIYYKALYNSMKQCFKCKISKPENRFYKNERTKDGLYIYCKACHSIITKKWQKENKELCSSIRKKRYNKKRKFLVSYKKGLKCQVCGESDSVCLVFHHRNPKEKDFYVGCSVSGYSLERIMKEIAKCDVLCANCHAKLHYKLRKK